MGCNNCGDWEKRREVGYNSNRIELDEHGNCSVCGNSIIDCGSETWTTWIIKRLRENHKFTADTTDDRILALYKLRFNIARS